MLVRVLGFAVLVCAASLARAADDTIARIEAFVGAEMERQHVPGVTVAVVRHGEPMLARGFGLANVEWSAPVTTKTMFQSGSVGKQFTSALVMQLVEAGKLTPDDKLTRFFPDAPAHWSTITVRHLLTHTSGIPDYTEGSVDMRRDYSEEELLHMAYTLKPEFAPGAKWSYSNTGYLLLGIVVRKVTGRFYGDLLAEQVFKPLGMTTAAVISEEAIVRERAGGYRLVDGQLRNQEWVAPMLNTTADGALYLSLEDLMAWDRGLRAHALLAPASWAAIWTAVTLNDGTTYPYGFGWEVDNVAGAPRHHHGGSWQGFRCYIARYTGADLSIIVQTNLAEATPARFVDGIARIIDPALVDPGVEEVRE